MWGERPQLVAEHDVQQVDAHHLIRRGRKAVDLDKQVPGLQLTHDALLQQARPFGHDHIRLQGFGLDRIDVGLHVLKVAHGEARLGLQHALYTGRPVAGEPVGAQEVGIVVRRGLVVG